MKNLFFLIIATFSLGVFASPTSYNRYEKPFIFIENGIEFAVFNDGQFDFNILRSNYTNLQINTRNINFSFNSGHNYNAFVQHDNYGAVIQIENTPIFYDYYGRVRKIGGVRVNYNHYGLASYIGNLRISYNSYGVYTGCSGVVNSYRCEYVPRHDYYRLPSRTHCVINTTPYRRYYTPRRYSYKNYSNRHVARPRYYATSRKVYRSNQESRYTNNRSYNNQTRRYATPKRNNSYKRSHATTGSNRKYVTRKSSTSNHRSYVSRNTGTRNNKSANREYTPRKSYASTTTNNRTYKRR